MNQHSKLFVCFIVIICLVQACSNEEKSPMVSEFKKFLNEIETEIIPLSKAHNLAYFDASISGAEDDYRKSADIEIQINKLFSSKDNFLKLKEFKASGVITDQLLKRQLDVLYNAFLAKQIDEKKLTRVVEMQKNIEKKFSIFRTEVDGKKLTDNEVEEILKTITRSDLLENAWMASKKVGATVAKDVLDLVRLRNEIATELGFKNYHAMQLELDEQNPEDVETLFDELDDLTRASFRDAKREVDSYLASRYGLVEEQLMPWHYQNRFFQDAPQVYAVNLDKYYKDQDIVKLTADYYAGLNLPIDDLLEKSDLFEKESKYQHAYCLDVDKMGDVRVLCNIKPNYSWTNTMLHEYGHAVYDKFQDPETPWLLREPAHTFTTEAIAMLFGRFASNPSWLQNMIGISNEEKQNISEECFKTLRLEQLVFSRWVQVMYRFEKDMYENPEQDLNSLWWQLVEKYQLLQKPAGRNAPDWASKIHMALYPAYYHNYMMGELLASQLYYHICKKILNSSDVKTESFVNEKAIGEYLIQKIFKPGAKYHWRDLIKNATGEALTAKYFAKQFVE